MLPIAKGRRCLGARNGTNSRDGRGSLGATYAKFLARATESNTNSDLGEEKEHSKYAQTQIGKKKQENSSRSPLYP